MEMEVNGLRVHYVDTAGDKPTLLFLHGWAAPVSEGTYDLLIDHLSQNFRVVAPDLAGFGGSEEPREPWCVDDYVAFTVAFANALGLDEMVLMCHSYGGRISIKLLSQDPCPLHVKKAVFIDAAGIRPKRSVGYYAKVYSYKCMKKLAAVPPIAKLCPSLPERVKKRAGSADYRNASEVMRATLVRSVNEDLTALLSKIAVSTLLIWGECDTATPLTDGKLMEKKIADAGLVTLAGAGHFSFAQRWGQCARVLDSFLL